MPLGIHGEKINAAIHNTKVPDSDKKILEKAFDVYKNWKKELIAFKSNDLDKLIAYMVEQLNKYKNFIDIDLIFDSQEDFLYRQKGQLKLDNTIIEEFLPILVQKCLECSSVYTQCDIQAQTEVFSSMYFTSSLVDSAIGGGVKIKTKDQDFAMSRKLYIKSSFDDEFKARDTVQQCIHIGYIMAELKTNLDKTMYQEAVATSHDIKQAVVGAKYYLLCDYLDMTPISTQVTDIDEILILRKAKRINSNKRERFNTVQGRREQRSFYIDFLHQHPYSESVFKRFINHILAQFQTNNIEEDSILNQGYF